ncbi:MAG: insulinase family protein [Hydrogeniiclostridium mannosilyticum]
MDVAQSKLVMGFRTGIAIPDSRLSAAKLMCTIFGGTPHSKLFLNVREKLSLCYYCSSQLNSMKGIMLVQSGVETKNIERAKRRFLQLQQMKDGDFSEDDIIAAKKSCATVIKRWPIL